MGSSAGRTRRFRVWLRAAGAWAAPVKEADPQAELLLPGRGLRGQRQSEAKEGGREEDRSKRGRGRGSRARVLNSERGSRGRRARSGVTAGAHLRWRARASVGEALW